MEEEEANNPERVIILASSSPRRKRILEQLDIDFDVMKPVGAAEKNFKDPYKTVKYNSSIKAKFIYNHVIMNDLKYKNSIIAGFDTIVFFRDKYLGKPSSQNEAFDYVKLLSGKVHSVITGLTVVDVLSEKAFTDTESTEVRFRKLKDSEIENYLKIERVDDKAGAYDISGLGSILVEKINGCFFNVAGLPVFRFIKLLERVNYKIL